MASSPEHRDDRGSLNDTQLDIDIPEDREPPADFLSITRQWVHLAKLEMLELHLLATDPAYDRRQDAFARMARALSVAIEQVATTGQTLGEEIRRLRAENERLLAENGRLSGRSPGA